MRGFCTSCSTLLISENSYIQVFEKGSGKCRTCSRIRTKQIRQNMSPADKQKLWDSKKMYQNTPKGRHTELRRVLRKEGVDATDPLWNFSFYSQIVADGSCHYCGGLLNAGSHALDRVDNKVAHTCYNTVPCCWRCNDLKSDDMSYEEMMLLVPALREICRRRKCNTL